MQHDNIFFSWAKLESPVFHIRENWRKIITEFGKKTEFTENAIIDTKNFEMQKVQ